MSRATSRASPSTRAKAIATSSSSAASNSSANFFVNGFRDDVQFFRDLYNAQSIEVLKGPSALTFGRGAGGGVLNRTLKEADGAGSTRRRADGLIGRPARHARRRPAINDNVAARRNVYLRGQRSFRRLQPSRALRHQPDRDPGPTHHQDQALLRIFTTTAAPPDRGNPSQGLPGGVDAFQSRRHRSRRTAI